MRAWLQLIRLPAVFTAPADIILGFLLNHSEIAGHELRFALLVVSSLCLYMAGMVFNDVFDCDIDARERPQRPIPSGRISAKAAATFGSVLLVLGVAAAAFVGLQSVAIAVGLVTSILVYDSFLKRTPLGPLGMGACRFLNVMLGASAHGLALAVWSRYQYIPAAFLGLYIVGVTWFARNEAGTSSRWSLAGATAVVLAAIGGLAWFVSDVQIGDNSQQAMLALAATGLILSRRLLTTVATPEPERVQSAVKFLLISYVLVVATLIFAKTGRPEPTFAAAALLIPAMIAGRWLYVT